MGPTNQLTYYMFYNIPFYTDKENLEVALGAITFRDEVIDNLRQQIVALRKLAEADIPKEFIDKIQYEHLK